MPFLRTLLLFALLLVGCVHEEFPGADSVAEGGPARIELSLTVLAMSSGSSIHALTSEQESKIKNLWVMVFRADGSMMNNGRYISSDSKFVIDSYSGSNYTLFFVASVSNVEIEARLQSAIFLSEVEEIVTAAIQLDFGMNTTHPLMMTGKQEDAAFAPGNSTCGIPIQLYSIATKATLIVIDKTPTDQEVGIMGWDVENTSVHSYLFLHTADVSVDLPDTFADKDDHWLITDTDYPFEAEDKLNKAVSQTFHVLENRRGGRVSKSLPINSADRYPGMSLSDKDDRDKGWLKPTRATTITIKVMHKTTPGTKQVKTHIYLGVDSHSDYNIEHGEHYTFTVTVNGLNDIKVDSNVDYVSGEPLMDHGDNLTMGAHLGFRSMRIHAPRGKVITEILDNSDRAYNDLDLDTTWFRISPSDLVWHQVKQSPPNDEWQQQAGLGSRMVRPKYIPHKSVRAKLQAQGIAGQSAIPGGQEDDDVIAFANATYRMCYKIMGTPLTEVTVTDKTLHVYADELLVRDDKRSAQVRFTFYEKGEDPTRSEVRMFNVNQERCISPFLDDNDPDAGLWILDEDGTPSNAQDKFVRERERECSLALYPGVPMGFQRLQELTWGFRGRIVYDKDDRWGNGELLIVSIVHNDMKRANNETVDFGKASTSYRPMYNGEMGDFTTNVPTPPYSGGAAPPYHHSVMFSFRNELHRPVYGSSFGRYCHEKNRNISGDGITEPAKTYWCLPSRDELVLLYMGIGTFENLSRYVYASVAENKEWTIGNGVAVNLFYHHLLGSPDTGTINKITVASRVFCVRSL